MSREPYSCPCCKNPWAAATGDLFAKLCAECEPVQNDKETMAIDRGNMNTEVLPSANFYQYSNGKWLEKNPIPPGYPVSEDRSKVILTNPLLTSLDLYYRYASTFVSPELELVFDFAYAKPRESEKSAGRVA